MLTLIQAIILGVVQGITEWLPISSEGITTLVLVNFFHTSFSEAIPLSIWLHTGTAFAVMVYFRQDIYVVLKGLPTYVKTRKDDLTTFIIISTAISGMIGLPIFILSTNFLSLPGDIATALIGLLLIITGLLQKYSRTVGRKQISWQESIIVGIAQGFSALPGLSRSGVTISTFLIRGYDAKDALKLSFLMSIPLVLAAEVGLALLGGITLNKASIIAVIISFIVGLLSINYFMKIAFRINFWLFCILLGIISFLPLAINLAA